MTNQQIVIQDSEKLADIFKSYDYDPTVENWIKNLTEISDLELLEDVMRNNTIEFSVDGSFFP